MKDITRGKEDRLIEVLQHTTDAENMLHYCLSHLARLIKNGRIRKRMNELAEVAKKNKEFLIGQLNDLNITNYFPENKCRFCNVKPESFSLIGAINLALEIIDIETKLYKDLLQLFSNVETRRKIKQILDTKIGQRIFLKKERKFVTKSEESFNFIDSYCLPKMVAELWK